MFALKLLCVLVTCFGFYKDLYVMHSYVHTMLHVSSGVSTVGPSGA